MVRTRLVRAYPAHNLKESLVVTEIIMNQNAGLPIDRKLLSEALNTSERSSSFTTLLAASQQYGLTVGKYNSDEISVTALSKSLFESVGHSSHTSYMLKAAYLPEKFQEIHNLLKDQPLPEGRFLKNLVLQNIKIHETQVEEFVDIYTSNYVFINEKDYSVSDPGAIQLRDNQSFKSLIYVFSDNSVDSEPVLSLMKKLNLEYLHVDIYDVASGFTINNSISVAGSIVCLPSVSSLESDSAFLFSLGVAYGSSPGKVIVIGMSDGLQNIGAPQSLVDYIVFDGSSHSMVQVDLLSSLNRLGLVSISVN